MRFGFCGDLDVPDWLLADIDLLSHLVTLFLMYDHKAGRVRLRANFR